MASLAVTTKMPLLHHTESLLHSWPITTENCRKNNYFAFTSGLEQHSVTEICSYTNKEKTKHQITCQFKDI